MDALAMLREDHRKVRELFRQFEEAEDKATKQAAAETALVELNIHAILEEEIFYPAVRRQGNGTTELVRRAEQEHHTADQLMDELMKMEAGNAEFDAKFHVLIENVKKHIEEEESEMLPIAAEVGMARLERLGEQMEQRKQTLMREGNGRGATRRRASTGTTRSRRTTAKSSTRRSTTSGTRRASTRKTSASGTRRTTATGTRRTTASSTRTRSSTGTRSRSTGTRSRSTAGSRTRASTARAKSSTGATASRAKTSAKRTVKQAGSKTRTTKTRSNTSGRRSGSQSGR